MMYLALAKENTNLKKEMASLKTDIAAPIDTQLFRYSICELIDPDPPFLSQCGSRSGSREPPTQSRSGTVDP
jgi:hypothetical protein